MTPDKPTVQSPQRAHVLLISGAASGGVRSHVAQCARLYTASGHDVIVAAPEGVLSADLGEARRLPLMIGSRPQLWDSGVLARIRRQSRGADIVHAHGLRAGALACLAVRPRAGSQGSGRGPRLIVTLHNRTVGGRLTRSIGQTLERIIYSRADVILAVSPDLLPDPTSTAAQCSIAVIPAPQRETQHAPQGETVGARSHAAQPEPSAVAAHTRYEQERHAQARTVLTVARLAPQKGLQLLADTAALLRDSLPQVRWYVAGDGPGETELRARIAAADLPMTLLGRREDIPDLMRNCDVLVQTSLWEGQPLTLQEGLRAGCAIVATDVGGSALTARGGATLVPPEVQAIAQALTGLLTEEAALTRARQRARKAAEALPTAQDLASQLSEVCGIPMTAAA